MLYAFLKRFVAPILKLVLRPRVEGLENVPRYGPLIVASNHLSFIDSFIIPMVLPRPVTFIAKAEYFTGTRLKHRFVRWFLTSMGHVPVHRGARRAAMGALEQALDILEQGGAFGIYPEGTRSEDGRLYRGRTGAGWLVIASGASVLPIGISGSERLMPVGATVPRIQHRATVRIGKPMGFTQYKDESPARARRAITDDIMRTIQELSGQQYAGVYNKRAAIE